jgi:hypothetical protein
VQGVCHHAIGVTTPQAYDAKLLPGPTSGPRVVRLFTLAMSVLWLVNWWSWGIQAMALVGRHGLLPLAEFFARAHQTGSPTPLEAPSLFWLFPNDVAVMAALVGGVICATLAVCRIAPRRSLALSALLYISFIAPSAPFLPQLTDRLLLEATGLLLLLPRHHPGRAMHWLAMGLIFKLYVEMGMAQWLAPSHDWQTGLALGAMLESTPLPTPLGWYVAHLPSKVLGLLTRAIVLLEIMVPWLILGPRAFRLVAAGILTCLQLGLALTCNYGLFAWVAITLHFFLLGDEDVARLEADLFRLSPMASRLFGKLTGWVSRSRTWGILAPAVFWLRQRAPVAAPAARRGVFALAPAVAGAAYLALSLAAYTAAIRGPDAARQNPALARLTRLFGPWHMVNAYSQLGAPPVGRNEPQLEVMVHNQWQAIEFWHQPSDPWKPLKFTAPHQPRLDVELSAYGRRGQLEPVPHFVGRIMETFCDDPHILSRLVRKLPAEPVQSVRLSLWHYSFANDPLAHDTGVYWQRERIAIGPILRCNAKQNP